MSPDPAAELETPRTLLRRWQPRDRPPFARINADPAVMRYLPRSLSRAESDALVDRIENHFATWGFGLWALELRATGALAGFVGLQVVRFAAPFVDTARSAAASGPTVEMGWRLDRAVWGRGYATEAARRAIACGFETWGLREIVAFTVSQNSRSIALMERLGMTRDPADDFDHPLLPPDSPLRHHVLYRLRSRSR